jgi:hypothetical protein
MAKPRKKKVQLPKTTAEWEALDTQEVMRRVFGEAGQELLKESAEQPVPKPLPDNDLP